MSKPFNLNCHTMHGRKQEGSNKVGHALDSLYAFLSLSYQKNRLEKKKRREETPNLVRLVPLSSAYFTYLLNIFVLKIGSFAWCACDMPSHGISVASAFSRLSKACLIFRSGLKIRRRSRRMSLSEIMTILIAFHQSYYRTR